MAAEYRRQTKATAAPTPANKVVDDAAAKKLNEASADSMSVAPADDSIPTDGTGVIKLDPWLGPFKDDLKQRFSKAQEWIQKIDKYEGGMDKFSKVAYTNCL